MTKYDVGWLPVQPHPPWVCVDEYGKFLRDENGKVKYFKTRELAEIAAKEASK